MGKSGEQIYDDWRKANATEADNFAGRYRDFEIGYLQCQADSAPEIARLQKVNVDLLAACEELMGFLVRDELGNHTKKAIACGKARTAIANAKVGGTG